MHLPAYSTSISSFNPSQSFLNVILHKILFTWFVMTYTELAAMYLLLTFLGFLTWSVQVFEFYRSYFLKHVSIVVFSTEFINDTYNSVTVTVAMTTRVLRCNGRPGSSQTTSNKLWKSNQHLNNIKDLFLVLYWYLTFILYRSTTLERCTTWYGSLNINSLTSQQFE
jgi:hypothetical protein